MNRDQIIFLNKIDRMSRTEIKNLIKGTTIKDLAKLNDISATTLADRMKSIQIKNKVKK